MNKRATMVVRALLFNLVFIWKLFVNHGKEKLGFSASIVIDPQVFDSASVRDVQIDIENLICVSRFCENAST